MKFKNGDLVRIRFHSDEKRNYPLTWTDDTDAMQGKTYIMRDASLNSGCIVTDGEYCYLFAMSSIISPYDQF